MGALLHLLGGVGANSCLAPAGPPTDLGRPGSSADVGLDRARPVNTSIPFPRRVTGGARGVTRQFVCHCYEVDY